MSAKSFLDTSLEGRVWCFGDHINTDLMYPTETFLVPHEERPYLVFESIRQGWSRRVKKGDIIVGGINFGTGSGRPAAELLKILGIRALVAESINGLFFRSCINYALPAMEVPGIAGFVQEGHRLKVDVSSGLVKNLTTDKCLEGSVLPPPLLELIEDGGLIAQLRSRGYVESTLPA